MSIQLTRVASGSETSSFRLFIDDEAITDTIKVGTTGDWDTYSVITAKTSKLKKGSQILKIAVTGSYVNIDHIKFHREPLAFQNRFN